MKFVIFLSLLGWNFQVYGAKVKKIKASKGLVLLDGGSEDGWEKGEEVCVVLPVENKNKKIACGTLAKVKKNASILKLAPSKAAKVEVGQSVISKAELEKEVETGEPFLSFRAFYLPTIMTSGVYNDISYLAPDTGATSLWNIESQENQSLLLSFGGEVLLPQWKIALGGRYRNYTSFLAEAYYDLTNKDLYISNTESAYALGFYADYFFFSKWNLSLGLGLDFDYSSLAMTSVLADQSGQQAESPFYTVSSTLGLVSLRVPIKGEIPLASFGFSAGVQFLVPLFSLFSNFQVDGTDTLHGSLISDPQTDLQNQLGHASGFGLEFSLGVSYSL